jgi:hypothetical protein
VAKGSFEETCLERTNERTQVEGRCTCLNGRQVRTTPKQQSSTDSVECNGSKKEDIVAHQTPSGCISSQPPPTNVDNGPLASAQKELCARIHPLATNHVNLVVQIHHTKSKEPCHHRRVRVVCIEPTRHLYTVCSTWLLRTGHFLCTLKEHWRTY